ncbi:MAG TPA: argininosuccinate synthase, partial [Victivallales bacterium]|nr:argininosuccinate synthase [Victivallales bacterium]
MKVVVAYSGGLDTSVILKWVKEKYDAEVIAFCADLGQEEELNGLDEKAKNTGASKCYIRDLKEEFAKDFIFPMFQANAIYEGAYLLGTSIARPLIAKHLIKIAEDENADAICHGATGKGNDQVRFELTAYALNPNIKIIAPWREWEFKSRTDLINYAKQNNIPVPVTTEKPYSMDRNLLHISFEGGILEDPWVEAPEEMSVLTRPLSKSEAQAEYITISFEKGIPVKLNDKELSPATMMKALNDIGARHAIGRIDIVENRFVGMKSRGV